MKVKFINKFLNFNDTVVVTKKGFYKGAKGVVIYYDSSEQQYEVLLDHGVRRSFYLDELKKLRSRK